MTPKPTLIERRRHRRFQLNNGACILCHPRTPPCQVINISKSGLAFCYTAGETGIDDSEELDIFCCDNDFFLTDIPFETVSDCILTDIPADGRLAMHRRGVKFGLLSPRQTARLEDFIDTSTGVFNDT